MRTQLVDVSRHYSLKISRTLIHPDRYSALFFRASLTDFFYASLLISRLVNFTSDLKPVSWGHNLKWLKDEAIRDSRTNQGNEHRNTFYTIKSAGFYSEQHSCMMTVILFFFFFLHNNWVPLASIVSGELSPFNFCRVGKLGFDLVGF